MERSLTMELVRVTEGAALASARWMGRGKKDEADGAATTAMRDVFDTVPMKGTVVIGEGERQAIERLRMLNMEGEAATVKRLQE